MNQRTSDVNRILSDIQVGTVNGIQIQRHLEKIYDELILETYGKKLR